MKVISFLGKAEYSPTTYFLGDQEYHTRFFPAALAHFLKPEKLLICATPTVQQHENLVKLGEELDQLAVAWKTIPIPEGHSELDLWEIFDQLTEAVVEGEEIAFDVTHSFRSLPFLAFLAMAYLKAAKKVIVERVYYGAWEARDKQANRSPVFDLTPFVALLDWLTATNRFVQTGDGQQLADLLNAGMPAGPRMRDDPTARSLGRQLKIAAEAIESASLALRLVRPMETMQSAAQLHQILSQAMPGIIQKAKPFSVLAEQVVKEYGQFGLENPADENSLARGLELQLKMVKWYIDRRQVVQAAALAREWIVSLLTHCFAAPMFDYDNSRAQIELALNNAAERRKPSPRKIKSGNFDQRLENLSVMNEIVRVWSQISELRNDIAHVGMRVSAKPAHLLKHQMEMIYPSLQFLAGQLLASPEP